MGVIYGGLSTEHYDRAYPDRELIRRTVRRFRPEWQRMVLVASLILLNALLNVAQPLLIGPGIDLIASRPSLSAAAWLALALLGSGTVSWALAYLRERASVRATADVVLSLRMDVLDAALRHDMAFYDQTTTGEMVSRIASDTQDFAQTVSLVVNLLSQAVLIAILLGVLLAIHWPLALLVLALAPLVILVSLLLRKVSRPAALEERRMRAVVNAQVQESVSGIAVAKDFRQEQALYDEFQQINRRAYRVGLRRGLVLENIFTALDGMRAVAVWAVLYAGGLLTLGDQLSPGTWYLFIQALELFMGPLVSIAAFWGQFQDGLAAAERVFALIDAEPRVVQTAAQPVGRLAGGIEFRDVCFAYRRGEDVLSGFSLTIRPGETLAFVGHTGAGKSSLARLIARFYEFQEGQILVDGRDIRSFDLPQYRRQIGMVPQSPFLFSGTLLDNVRYGVPEADEGQVLAAVRRIGGGDWLDDLPSGLQTDVGERGATLSMGQRQLVALARVLIRDPAILLLDEATASVDPFTEAQIQEGLETVFRDRTSIVIAHRLSTVQNADRIVVLEEGAIIEQGTHRELLARGGHYATLYNTYFRHQSRDYVAGKGKAL